MDELEKNSKLISKLFLFFLVIGLIEIIVYIFILPNFFAIIPGFITIIAALNSFNKMTNNKEILCWNMVSN